MRLPRPPRRDRWLALGFGVGCGVAYLAWKFGPVLLGYYILKHYLIH